MQEHNNLLLIEAIERYIAGEMTPDERLHFENLRKENGEVDQLVVSHTLFMQKMNRYNEWEKFHKSLNKIHTDLSIQGKINSSAIKGRAKIVYLFNRYKRVASIAASIAGLTALTVSAIIWSVAPKSQTAKMEQLSRHFNILEDKSRQQEIEINNLKSQGVKHEKNKTIANISYDKIGTGFIIDNKGLIVTNSHVIQNASNIAVQNASGSDFLASIVYNDPVNDIAILKISDKNFKELPPIPYSFSKKSGDLAEPIYTLGYPREEIVYGEGYLSSKTGYNGDTLSCQIEIAANRGNSGSPILNNKGEIIGILNGRQKDVEGFVFVLQTANVYKAVNNLKHQNETDALLNKLKLNNRSTLQGLSRTQQVKKLQDYVYMVKVN